MCDVCCREFKGWCMSFTKTEMFLCILECTLLVIFTVLFGFVISHFLVCSEKQYAHEQNPTVVTYRPENDDVKYITVEIEKAMTDTSTAKSATITSDVQCTWKESEKTEAATHYYEHDKVTTNTTSTILIMAEVSNTVVTSSEIVEFSSDFSDGGAANDAYRELVLALVKIRSLQHITFGCILVKITRLWTLTAISCIEAIKKVDSLDSFVMLESYGEQRRGRSHPIADVRMHPLYGGTNRSYDLVALRSQDELGEGPIAFTLPTMLDYYFTTIGERLTILGFRRYRNVESQAASRGLRAAAVWVAAAGRCGGGGGARPLCCRPRAAREQPCDYCAGSALLADRPLLGGRPPVLLGVMADNPQCGASCGPALFVSLAAPAVRGWLHAVVAD